MRFVFLAAAIAAIALASVTPGFARPHPTPTPAPTPTPVADPAITKIARQQFVQWQAGSINKSLYAQQVLAKLDDKKIASTSAALGELGALEDVVFIGPWTGADFP